MVALRTAADAAELGDGLLLVWRFLHGVAVPPVAAGFRLVPLDGLPVAAFVVQPADSLTGLRCAAAAALLVVVELRRRAHLDLCALELRAEHACSLAVGLLPEFVLADVPLVAVFVVRLGAAAELAAGADTPLVGLVAGPPDVGVVVLGLAVVAELVAVVIRAGGAVAALAVAFVVRLAADAGTPLVGLVAGLVGLPVAVEPAFVLQPAVWLGNQPVAVELGRFERTD